MENNFSYCCFCLILASLPLVLGKNESPWCFEMISLLGESMPWLVQEMSELEELIRSECTSEVLSRFKVCFNAKQNPKIRKAHTELIWGRFLERFPRHKKLFSALILQLQGQISLPSHRQRHSHADIGWLNGKKASRAPDLCPAANHTLILVLFQKHNHWPAEDSIKWHMQDRAWCFMLRSPGHCSKIPVLWQRKKWKLFMIISLCILFCSLQGRSLTEGFLYSLFLCRCKDSASRTVSFLSQIHPMRRFPQLQQDTRKTENKRQPHGLSWVFNQSHPTRLVL